MNLNRWLSVILMTAFFLALNPLGAQAEPPCGHHPKYHHPRGNAYGWHGKKHHGFDRHQKHFRRDCDGMYAHHGGPPHVAYVTPVTPMIGIPYSQPQSNYQPANPGLSGNLNWNF